MTLKPYTDECTTFENVRLMKINEGDLEVAVVRSGEKVPFKNTKQVKIYYNTDDAKIMNTLQEVRLASDDSKLKVRLDELVACSNIQSTLKKWIESTFEQQQA